MFILLHGPADIIHNRTNECICFKDQKTEASGGAVLFLFPGNWGLHFHSANHYATLWQLQHTKSSWEFLTQNGCRFTPLASWDFELREEKKSSRKQRRKKRKRLTYLPTSSLDMLTR